ncbi:hypothetical protein MPH47_21325 [Psychrobacillus psychrodurans]|uniref:hypothetical protein n=1 Tax=Psychrobacillus psychrodurans TaxID=126157 RepID=UPI001F4E8DD2|nr:hypothetical protein [Psychrobacillus psychrodurans]MCK1999731.1 hypothetical protein [Psychrobacillus psychrodurans]
MPDYKVTFKSNVKLGQDLYRTGEEATVSEEVFESIKDLKVIESKFEQIEKAPKTVEEMTVTELKKYAKDNGIDLGEAKKQKEILEAIQAAENNDDSSNGEGNQTPPEE